MLDHDFENELLEVIEKALAPLSGIKAHYVLNKIVPVIEKYAATQQSAQADVLPCGHDSLNLRMGVNGYGCAECAATRH